MLLSLVLALTPTEPFTVHGFYGRQARAWFLAEVDRHSPRLAEALHQGDGQRPYTVSSLWCEAEEMAPGTLCYLRITSLAAPLTELLAGSFLEHLPSEIRVRDALLQPLGRATWHAWDREATCEQLVEEATSRGRPPRITFHFASPTAFRSQEIDRPLPVPGQVWRSLHQKWQATAPEHLGIHELWQSFARAGIAISDFGISSQKVIFKRGRHGAATGAVGHVTYRLLPTRYCGDFAEVREGAGDVLHTLGAFALFCGVGHHTAIGLGQVRAVDDAAEADGRIMTPRYQNVKMG